MALEIKICGLTRLTDALKAAELGADYAGFILYRNSPRFISIDALASITKALPDGLKKVGVFVNATVDEITEAVRKCSLDVIQLHGNEDLRSLPKMPAALWKAVRVAPGDMGLPPDAGLAERIVLDTSVEGMYGGTGRQIDIESAAKIARKAKVMLGGGMNPANVAAAVAAVRPAGVDVSSGVESKPGVKDHSKMADFIKAARSA